LNVDDKMFGRKQNPIRHINETPHLMSRGGYKMLELKLVEQKIKAHFTSIKEWNNVDSLKLPSLPSLHEK